MIRDMSGPELTIRRATPDDRAAVVELCRVSLGWSEGDLDEAFFSWKHDQNPFGVSPAWIAQAPGGELVGMRVFLRWGFVEGDGERLLGVRAVDTVTHPEWQGKGIFTRLTLGALPELRTDGVDFVFNTPNDKSRPGYLKMGWSLVGRVPVSIRVGGVGAVRRLAGAKAAAALWSEPSAVGVDAAAAFDDVDQTERLLRLSSHPGAISTDRTVDFLKWRYRFEPLHYRVLPLGDSLAEGALVFRVRRRGTALEVTVCEVLAPSRRRLAPAFRELLRSTGADFLLVGGHPSFLNSGCVPVPRIGPALTWRPINRLGAPGLGDLALTMGDLELF